MIPNDKEKLDPGDDDVMLYCDPKFNCINSCKWILPDGEECL